MKTTKTGQPTPPTYSLVTQRPAPTVLERVLGCLQRILCSIHGHDALQVCEDGRVFLRCSSCGHESVGWTVDKPELAPYRPTITGVDWGSEPDRSVRVLRDRQNRVIAIQ